MANQKHLNILKQGVRIWNNWRRENPDIIPDLRGADFTGKDFTEADFSKAFIQGTNFTKTKLRGAKFMKAEAGLTRFGVIKLLIGMFFISALLGFIFLFLAALLGYFFTPEAIDQNTPFPGFFALALFVIIFYSVSRFGVKPELLGVIVGGTLVLIAFGWFLTIAGVPWALYRDEVPALILPGPALVVGAIAEAFTIVTAAIVDGKILGGHRAWFSSLAGVLFGIFVAGFWTTTAENAIDMAKPTTKLSTVTDDTLLVKSIIFLLVLATVLVSIYIARSTLANKEENALILAGAVFLAATGGTSFRGADLTDADFTEAKLRSADFRDFTQAALGSADLRRETKETKLIGTCWRGVRELNRVRPGTTYLQYKEICDLLVTGDGERKHFNKLLNLQGINLKGANLTKSTFIDSDLNQANLEGAELDKANLNSAILKKANLRNANLTQSSFIESDLNQANLEGAKLADANLETAILSQANLRNADLSRAKLVQAQLYESDLTRATLTGAYIEDWGISVTTKLLQVHCDYIYMKTEEEPDPDRRPADKTRNFEPGELASLVGMVAKTVDLVFQNGIDWKAFLETFTKLQQEYQDEDLSIQAIEKKLDGAFVVKLNVSEKANKSLIESQAKKLYEEKLFVLEESYRAELQAKEREIKIYKQQSADMMEIVKLQASRPISYVVEVEAKALASSESQGDTIQQSGSFGVGVNKGEVKAEKIAGTIHEALPKSMAEVAAEIQQLLEQLSQTHPTSTTAEQMVVATEAIKRIESDPKLMERILSALKAGGISALEQLLNHPAASLVIAALEDWQKSKKG